MTIRSPEMEDRIVEGLMTEGMLQLCQRPGMPDRTTVSKWMLDDPVFSARCARARESHADVLAEGMANIETRTLSGELDPAAARVVLASQQWRASKLAPRRYGDKLAVSGAGPNGEHLVQKIVREIVDPKIDSGSSR